MAKNRHESRVLALLLAVSCGLLASSSTFAAPPDRAPVLLRKTLLLPPPEAAGTGLEPEVKLEVELDERGVVSKVEVLSIDPPSELDEVFRQATLEEIETWRYAPAVENGEAVATSLKWTVKFRSQEVSATSDFASGGQLGLAQELQGFLRRRDYVLALPEDQKKARLEHYASVAERYLTPGSRFQADTPRFVVVTDSTIDSLAPILANNLEASLNAMASIHEPELEPHPHGFKTLVYIYSKQSSLVSLRHELDVRLAVNPFFYLSPGLIAGNLEQATSSEWLLAVMIHEASHAYSDQRLRSSKVEVPVWFEEGMAEYMANSEIKDGELIPGRTLKRRAVLNHFRGGAEFRRTEAGKDLDWVKRQIRSEKAPTIGELVLTDSTSFYSGDDSGLSYGMSWLLVHFLRHGREEWQSHFSRLVLYLMEGYNGPDAIREVYGVDIADLDEPFRDYVKRF